MTAAPAAAARAPAFVLAVAPALIARTLAAGPFCIVAVVPPGLMLAEAGFTFTSTVPAASTVRVVEPRLLLFSLQAAVTV